MATDSILSSIFSLAPIKKLWFARPRQQIWSDLRHQNVLFSLLFPHPNHSLLHTQTKLIWMRCSRTLNWWALHQRMQSNGVSLNQWCNRRGCEGRDCTANVWSISLSDYQQTSSYRFVSKRTQDKRAMCFTEQECRRVCVCNWAQCNVGPPEKPVTWEEEHLDRCSCETQTLMWNRANLRGTNKLFYANDLVNEAGHVCCAE